MKALMLGSIDKINIDRLLKPSAGDNEVLIKIHSCGICGSDIPRVYQTGAHKMPLIIGHEFAGEIAEIGSDDADGLKVGDKVGIFPLIPCMECGPCKMKKYEMCRNYSYLGSRCDGGFAEYVAVPKKNIIELPDNVDMRAAAMLEPMAVAVHACRQIGLLPGNIDEHTEENSGKSSSKNPDKSELIVICGMGTIGLLVLMFLLEAGYTNITVIGNREIQRSKAVELGLDRERFIMLGESGDRDSGELIASLQADYYFECVGKQETYAQAINHTAPAGKVCLVGNPYGDMELPRDIYWKILRNQLTVTGTWNSSFTGEANDDWHYVVKRLETGVIHPEKLITHTYGIDDIIKGFELMRDKSEDYIKVMMVI